MQLKEGTVEKTLENNWFHVVLLGWFLTPILLLLTLDYMNIEGFHAFNVEGFMFLKTWKGRMFYLFFMWLLFLESIISWEEIVQKMPKGNIRLLLFFLSASAPLIYVLGVNFVGLNKAILGFGQDLGFTGRSLEIHWILSVEYLVFAIFFILAICLAYGKKGLNFFSISLSLLVGIGAIFTLDTFYPRGIFRPFELLALPTSACAAVLLEILGYSVKLYYAPPLHESMPLISTASGGAARIGWPCAGVHSLLLFVLIILLLFKKSSISNLRKNIYFVVGAVGTYSVNVLRITSFFIVMANSGSDAARFFHDTVGELYFIFWIFAYLLIIICIERFRLVERIRCELQSTISAFK